MNRTLLGSSQADEQFIYAACDVGYDEILYTCREASRSGAHRKPGKILRQAQRTYMNRHRIARRLLPYFEKQTRDAHSVVELRDRVHGAIPWTLVFWFGRWAVEYIWRLLANHYFSYYMIGKGCRERKGFLESE